MSEFFRRLRYLLHRQRFDQELADEMDFHREMAARDGARPFGNARRLREEARDAWGWTWLDRAAQDLRYAARTLWRSPGFTAAAVLTLAVGIGVNVAAFGFLNVAFLKPLPVRDPASLLRFERRAPDRFASTLPYPEVAFFRDHTRTLLAVLAVHATTLTLDGQRQPLSAQFVSENFFRELGTPARLGRLIDPALDAAAGADPVAVISHAGWQRRFASDPLIVGRVVTLNNTPVTVVGVSAPGFGGFTLDDPDLWLPIARHPRLVAGSRLLSDFSPETGVRMYGRMRPDVTAAAVEEDLRMLAATLRAEQPQSIWEHERIESESAERPGRGGGSSHGSGAPPTSKAYLVAGLSGTLVLLILAVACANLGSLLLARGVSRDRELAIRSAVGASRGRLVRQLFTESLLLAGLGCAAGVVVGQAVLQIVMSITSAPSWLDPTPDWRVLAFAVGMALATATLFGLAPAWQVARRRHHSTRIRHVLIGAQVAASCVLLIVAGLLVRALDRVSSTDPGFDYRHVLAINPHLETHGYAPDRAAAYLQTLETRLRALPGIESIAHASTPPLGRRKTVARADVDGRRVDIHVNQVDPEFFATMRIPLLRGRSFLRGEDRAIIVSESLGRALWPGQDPLGRQFDGHTVVGVAASARQNALQDPDAVEGYFPIEAGTMPALSILVRTSGPPENVLVQVAATAQAVAPNLFPETVLLATAYREKLAQAELTAFAVGLLGFSALLLACLGIVGLVTYSVAQRTKEIGIRMALGAAKAQVLSAVVQQLTRPMAAGLLIGVGAAAAFSQVLRRELYGISSLDPAAYVAAVTVFVVTIAAAAWWPARRALRVDPLRALRYD